MKHRRRGKNKKTTKEAAAKKKRRCDAGKKGFGRRRVCNRIGEKSDGVSSTRERKGIERSVREGGNGSAYTKKSRRRFMEKSPYSDCATVGEKGGD